MSAAIEKNTPLLTGDKEFQKVEDKVKIIWIGEKGVEPTKNPQEVTAGFLCVTYNRVITLNRQ